MTLHKLQPTKGAVIWAFTEDSARRAAPLNRQLTRCPKCDSPAPHLHPAVQFEGEVQPCGDPFHSTVTAQNRPERVVKEIKPDGTVVLMTKAEAKKWRKTVKTKIRSTA